MASKKEHTITEQNPLFQDLARVYRPRMRYTSWDWSHLFSSSIPLMDICCPARGTGQIIALHISIGPYNPWNWDPLSQSCLPFTTVCGLVGGAGQVALNNHLSHFSAGHSRGYGSHWMV